jgi:ABC-type multidrug transport system fused ATPase/permease subunit
VEQFFCHADSCTQDLGNGGASANWNCQNLQCTCRPGTTFCGAVKVSDLTQIIDGLSGTLEIDCGVVDNSTHTSTCSFKQATIQSVFGSAGLALNGCAFGECVRQSIIDNGGNVTTSSQSSSGGKPLSGGVIAGLAVVGGLVFLALVLLLLGCIQQRAARKARSGDVGGIKVNVEWNGVTYVIPTGADIFSMWPKGRKGDSGNISDEKVVLDSVSGTVKAGQMMAILGPSGACVPRRYL